MGNELAGKTALITGAGHGIGPAVAPGLGAVGAHEPLTIRADVGDDRQRREAVAAARACDPAGILISNARHHGAARPDAMMSRR